MDISRFDVTGSGKIKYSLKARSPAEAKKWVWALFESQRWMKDLNSMPTPSQEIPTTNKKLPSVDEKVHNDIQKIDMELKDVEMVLKQRSPSHTLGGSLKGTLEYLSNQQKEISQSLYTLTENPLLIHRHLLFPMVRQKHQYRLIITLVICKV